MSGRAARAIVLNGPPGHPEERSDEGSPDLPRRRSFAALWMTLRMPLRMTPAPDVRETLRVRRDRRAVGPVTYVRATGCRRWQRGREVAEKGDLVFCLIEIIS